ncbi:ParB N-terminal domain-containing protein [Parasphingopyxis algicola]|uniref:ParB/RepB/Spo0J family partition protein n=1 Tax=Parasphingopyxis algicola TaxID=2026624 RepID=UPI0015A08E7E|nr:ParB N-terminal domain-containing protein [Parasphingopyxis algicola]QLC25118.1 ParB N-terminal domain-containing protein [Parasphingopyxis algicola]
MTGEVERWATPHGAKGDGKVRLVPVDAIDLSRRLRPLDAGWAVALGHTMLGEGQRDPVLLAREGGRAGFRLVSGAHRLAAAHAFAGLSPVRAIVIGPQGAEHRLREIAAQFGSKNLPPIDRAARIADMRDLLDTGDLGDRDSGFSDDRVPRLHADRIAELTGLSRPDIERSLTLHRRLAARVAEMLRGEKAARSDTQLHDLSKLAWSMQEQIAYLLLDGARSVAEARATLQDRAIASSPAQQMDEFLVAFERMDPDDKRRALFQLARHLPEGMAITGI